VSRSMTLEKATHDSKLLYQTILDLLPKTQAGVKPVRLAGLAVGKLTEEDGPCQLGLFQQDEEENREQLVQAMDIINRRYGSLTIKPALLTGEGGKAKEKKNVE
jgi:hypothetical protein